MTQVSQVSAPKTTIQLFGNNTVQKRFEELLGKKSQGFISSVLQTVNNSNLLQKAKPETILNAAVTAAALDLPINQNLGFAWIVPYKGNAQFQMGWKGYVQLALRTGQYSRINVTEVSANQFVSFNELTEEIDADFSIEGDGKVVGYIGYFRLINSFEKTVFWSRAKVEKHAKKYSQSYKRGQGVWAEGEDGFDAMAKKTVLKNMIAKWGIMSIEMQRSVLADQAVMTEEGSYQYADNVPDVNLEEENKEEEMRRILSHIEKCDTMDDVEILENSMPDMNPAIREALDNRVKMIKKGAKKK